MINHIFTLLFNKSAEEINSLGIPIFVYVDPKFKPIDLPQNLKNFYNNVFSYKSPIDNFYLAKLLTQCALAPDLKLYSNVFDGRIIPDFVYDIKFLTYKFPYHIDNFCFILDKLVNIYNLYSCAFLFNSSNKLKINLQNLKQIWDIGNDAILKIGAITLAYVSHVDTLL